MLHILLCKNCGQNFQAKYIHKKFCTLKCYTGSEEFKNRLSEHNKAQREKARKEAGFAENEEPKVICLNCGKERAFTKRAYRAKEQKYCNQICYREYMANRFDRYVANPESLALPQDYDEFLTKDELPCLIENCNWSGRNLSQHMNFTHGIKADRFKELAGFNRSSGIVTPETSKALSENGGFSLIKMTPERAAAQVERLKQWYEENGAPKRNLRLEGKEHWRKAAVLNERFTESVCKECGKTFLKSSRSRIKKYCSVDCRNTYKIRINTENTIKMQCEMCKKDFLGRRSQELRLSRGLPVFCSPHCRGIRAGKIGKGTWAGI